MDYSFHGNPQWYQDICAQYDVLTERQVAELVAKQQSLSIREIKSSNQHN